MTTFDEVLYENNLSKIGISQFKEGYIIGFIINKIYIFNIEGDLEYISSPLINNQLSCHFTVGIDSFFNNKYYYLIGLLYSNKIYLKYYSYTPSSRTNYLYASEIFTDENYDYLNNYYLILNNGLTCDILNYKTEDLITCMYFVYYGPQKILLSHSKYMLYEGQIYYEYSSIYYEWDNAMLIKSIPGSHNSEAFYCILLSTGLPNCFLYDINNIDNTIYFEEDYNLCKNDFYTFKVYYFQQKEEYIFSCITLDGKIQIYLYNKTFDLLSTKIFDFENNCTGYFGYSILYLNDTNNTNNITHYYILSDYVCNGIEYTFEPLIFDKEENEIEEEVEDKNLEEEFKENEFREFEEDEKEGDFSEKEKKGNVEENEYINIEEKFKEDEIEEENFLKKEYENEKEEEEEISQVKSEIFENDCQKDKSKFIPEKKYCIDDCSKDDIFKYEYKNNCYDKCPNKTSSLLNNIYYCEIECSYDLPYEIIELQNCVQYCTIIDLFNNSCKLNYKSTYLEDNIINNFEKEIISQKYDSFMDNINNNIKTFKILNNIYQLSLIENQNNNENNNVSTVKFGECENKLRDQYNISKNISLLIFKMDIFVEGYKIPKIQYKIYNSQNKKKLDLSICDNMKVQISIPVEIDEKDLEKYNPMSSYYNDLCNTYTTEKKTDITLKDRKREYIDKNMTLYEEDCQYMGYDSKKKEALCECPIKINLFKLSEISINKTKLYDKFMDYKNIVNLNLMKCYKVLFTKKGILYNIGSYIVIFLILFYFISIIMFYKNDLKIIKNQIEQIIFIKNNLSNINVNINNKNNKKVKKEIKNKRNMKISKTNIAKINLKETNNKTEFKNKYKRKRKKLRTSIENLNSPPIKKSKKKIKAIKTTSNITDFGKSNENNPGIGTSKKLEISNALINDEKTKNIDISSFNKFESIKIDKTIMNLNDYEINTLQYKEALEMDKRVYYEYYFSLLKINHLLVFTFFRKNDYNSKIIKIM